MEVRVFDSRVEQFLSSFDLSTRARIAKTIHLLELFGSDIGMPHIVRTLGGVCLNYGYAVVKRFGYSIHFFAMEPFYCMGIRNSHRKFLQRK